MFFDQKRIYMDHAATTPLDDDVKREMDKFWSIDFGNPGSVYKEGLVAKKALENSRKKVAKTLNSSIDEIIFTSGGTESNNLAIFGFIKKLEEQKMNLSDMHMITSVIEHSSVLNCFRELEKKGVRIDYVGVDKEGLIDPKEIKKLLRPNTVFVSIMYANNEIGVIQPISKISRMIKSNGEFSQTKPVFHTDASQTPLYLDIDVKKIGVDMMTLDGQKIYGPKGVGVLYKKKTTDIKPILIGGGQENGLRPGTENIPLIVGFARALEIAAENKKIDSTRICELRDYFIDEVLEKISGSQLNGGRDNRLPNNINVFIPGIDNEFVIIQLDEKGIACSAKSACLGGEDKGSYVIRALGRDEDYARQSLRFSIGKDTTKKDIDYVVESLAEITRNHSG